MAEIKTIKINRDTSRDIVINNLKAFDYATNLNAKMQRIWIRLGINKGEWFLDTQLGVPWHDLLDNNATKEQIAAEVRKELLNDEYVQRVEYVNTLSLDKETRQLKLEFAVLLTTGETITQDGAVSV